MSLLEKAWWYLLIAILSAVAISVAAIYVVAAVRAVVLMLGG